MKNKFGKFINMYSGFAKINIRIFSEYPLDTLLLSVGLFIREISSLIGILTIASLSNCIGGWNKYQLLCVYALMACAEALSTFFFSSVWKIDDYVREGGFDSFLLRPTSVLFQMLSNNIYYPALFSFFSNLIILLFSLFKLEIEMKWGLVLFLLETVVCGVIINSSIYLFVNSWNFWFQKGNVANFLFTFREFARYPVHIFPVAIKVILTFFVPFAFVGYYPVAHICNKQYANLEMVLPVVTIISVKCALWIWKKGLKTYESTGT